MFQDQLLEGRGGADGGVRQPYVLKLQGLPGAGGAIQLNGEQLKTEAQTELDKLQEAIHNYEEGNQPLGFVIG